MNKTAQAMVDNPPPSPTPRYPQYTVAGRMLYNYGEALALARQLAVTRGARIPLMEKIDGWTPAHVLQWVEG